MLDLAATADAPRPSWPEVPPASAREVTALELALENASAGCVGETFGTWLALYQSEHAPSKPIRAVARRIARDEARHAALAFRIMAWLLPQLSPEQRQSVNQALSTAIVDVLASPWPSANLLASLGLPGRAEMGLAASALRIAVTRR
jgi:hypothetical protein